MCCPPAPHGSLEPGLHVPWPVHADHGAQVPFTQARVREPQFPHTSDSESPEVHSPHVKARSSSRSLSP